MSTIGTTPGQQIGLSKLSESAARTPKVKLPEPVATPAIDTVDISDKAKKIIAAGTDADPILRLPIGESPLADEPVVTYVDGYYPASFTPPPKQAPIVEPVDDTDGIEEPVIITTVGGNAPVTKEPTPIAIDAPYTPPVDKFPKPVVSTMPQPVTIDTVYTLNPKFSGKTQPLIQTPTVDTASGAAKLSHLSGRFIAPYNTVQYLELFGS